MRTLAAAETIQGVAAVASKITYTIQADQIVAGADAFSTVAQGQLAAVAGALVTSPALTQTLINEMTFCNTDVADRTITIYQNGTAAANQLISITLKAGYTLTYNATGWHVTDTVGNVQTGVIGPTGTTGTTGPTGSPTVMGAPTGATANGGVISGGTLQLSPASTTTPGIMSAADKAHVTDLFDNQWYNVQDHGVAPGNTAAANVTALNALLTLAPSGSVIFFPGGSYAFNAKITVPAKAFIFKGVGGAGITGGFTILEWTSNVADNLIQLTSSNWYSQFYDLVFATTVNQTAGAVIAFNDNVATHIKNCTFGPLGGTLFNVLDFTGTHAGETTVIDTVNISGFTGVGININANLTSPMIVNTNIQGQWGTATQTATAGIQIQNAGAVQVDNSDIIGCNNNMLINPAVGIVVASVYVTNTYMDNSNGSCLKITGAGTPVRCRFIACSFTTSSATAGLSAVEISVTVAAGAQGIDFENCSVLNTFTTTGTTNGFLISGTADFSIIACRVAGWTNGVQVTPVATNGVTKPLITDNTIGTTGGFGANTVGIMLNVGAAQYGQVMIQNNQMLGNTTPLLDNSTVALSIPKFIAGNAGMVSAPNPIIAATAAINTTETYPGVAVALPANSLRPGTHLRLTLIGTCTSSGTAGISTWTARVGTTGTTPASDTTATAAMATTAAATTGTAIPFKAEINITCRATGASTALECSVLLLNAGVTGIISVASAGVVAAASTFNNNAALFLNVSYKTANAVTTSTFQQAFWEVISQ